MDLAQIKRFLVAAEVGNLRRAAASLHVSQPALTQSIKALESQLGVELFERSARGVGLTAYGRALVPRARLMLNERERILGDFSEIRSQGAARVTVGVAPYFTRQLFPAAALRTLETSSLVQIHVIEGHTTELVTALQEGRIELAFCVRNACVDVDRSLRFTELYTERYSVMARPGHALFRRRRVTDRDLAECGWVVYDSQATAGYLGQHFERAGLTPPRWSFSTLSLPLMVSLVSRSDLLALMPEDYVVQEIAASRLRRLRGHGIAVTGEGGVLVRRDAVLGPAAMELIENLGHTCAEAQRTKDRASLAARAAGLTIRDRPPAARTDQRGNATASAARARSKNEPAADATSSGASIGG